MILFLLRTIATLCFFMASLQGMNEHENAEKALVLWRMKKLVVVERPLPCFSTKESVDCLSNAYDLKRGMHPFSFFYKKSHSFYVKRLVKYSCLNAQGCEFNYEYVQPDYDKFDPGSRELVVDGLPSTHRKDDLYNACEGGAWYCWDYKVGDVKDLIVKIASSLYSGKENALNPEGVLLSDDYFYMILISIDEKGDRLLLFYPCKPLVFDTVFAKIADCYMRFV